MKNSIVEYRRFYIGSHTIFAVYQWLDKCFKICISVLYADDTNVLITATNMNALCHQLNRDLRNVQE